MLALDYLRRELTAIRPGIPVDVFREAEEQVRAAGSDAADPGLLDALVDAARRISFRCDQATAWAWSPGDAVPIGWVECYGHMIRRIDADNPTIQHDGVEVAFRPGVDEGEIVVDRVGDPRPIVVRRHA